MSSNIHEPLHEENPEIAYEEHKVLMMQLMEEKDARIAAFEKNNEFLSTELSTKNLQIDQLHQLVAIGEKNVAILTEQLNDKNNLIEELRAPQPNLLRRAWFKLNGAKT